MDPFIGQISTTAFDFAPRGWMLCNGQTLAIAQNQALFSIIGTSYGGDGRTTFQLPDLRGRAAMHASGAAPLGMNAGSENVTLVGQNNPAHTHTANCFSTDGDASSPTGAVWAKSANNTNKYAPLGTAAPMAANASGQAGGGQAHNNMPPMQVLNFIIAIQGIYPSRN